MKSEHKINLARSKNSQSANAEEVSLNLRASEIAVLKCRHLYLAKYWRNIAMTNDRLAKEHKKDETDCFMHGPCKGKPKTPENWRKRAKIFKQREREHIDRAAVFDL